MALEPVHFPRYGKTATIDHNLWSILNQPSSLLFSSLLFSIFQFALACSSHFFVSEGIALDFHSHFSFLHASVRRTVPFLPFVSFL